MLVRVGWLGSLVRSLRGSIVALCRYKGIVVVMVVRKCLLRLDDLSDVGGALAGGWSDIFSQSKLSAQKNIQDDLPLAGPGLEDGMAMLTSLFVSRSRASRSFRTFDSCRAERSAPLMTEV